MALGDIVNTTPDSIAVEALASAIATNSAPTGSAGIEANALRAFGYQPNTVRVLVLSTAGSGTMTATIKLWGKYGALGWVILKALNGGSAIAETSADIIAYSEEVSSVGGCDRYYVEIAAIAGTATAVKAEVIVSRQT